MIKRYGHWWSFPFVWLWGCLTYPLNWCREHYDPSDDKWLSEKLKGRWYPD